MMKRILILTLILLNGFSSWASENALKSMPVPIEHVLKVKPEKPILILHRGGVITPEAPECSLAAARLAGEQGYDMLEVDVRESKDGVPVSFHDNTMMEDTGKAGKAEDYTAEELSEIYFYGSQETVPTLEQIVEVCNEFGMGLMLNIKTDGSDEYYETIKAMIIENGLQNSTVCIDPYEKAVEHLSDVSLFPLSQDELAQLRTGEAVDAQNKFWFGWPRHIENETVAMLQDKGILVIPSINIFHYPKEEHMKRAEEDIERMKEAGVLVFQIDSVYAAFFE